LLPPIPAGSTLLVTATFAGQKSRDSNSRELQSFELLLNEASDCVVVQRPSWWSVRNALLIVGGMTFVLAASAVWITLLRRRVEARTLELKGEIDIRRQTEVVLKEKTIRLEDEIEERKRMEQEVEQINRQLIDASRHAGQAEVASSVLHNVGNVLNSVNVSATMIADRVRKLRVGSVSKAAELMLRHRENLGSFIEQDPKGQHLPNYLEKLGLQLADEQASIAHEAVELSQNIEHIKEIVTMQQNYARVVGVSETIPLTELADSAVKLQARGYQRHHIELVRDYDEVPPITVDRHKVLQIVVNLLQNAKQACQESRQDSKRIILRIWKPNPEHVEINVIDNGIGIPEENIVRIFGHGFTTRKNGHGFGLHGSALAAKQLGGTLTAHSDGPGLGASFRLQLPV
jgi:signal transduction histidine kinase